MRNLVATLVTTTTSDDVFSRIHRFCVDAERLCVWAAVDEDLCCVEAGGKVKEKWSPCINVKAQGGFFWGGGGTLYLLKCMSK